ncbi:hypothetical protein [Aeromonas sp. HMWF014]|uniref:hypothetical protein n=1 Tax=Aeromonas sp. HMWF014 TaxID=2056850 RepID=UPI0015E82353|nr:hypothetical protein [Aeromonas sp. HMWF014]
MENVFTVLINMLLHFSGSANIDTGLTKAIFVTVTDYQEVAAFAIFSHFKETPQ